jgi:ABC-type branched-subunit amino acid transport system ATPase component
MGSPPPYGSARLAFGYVPEHLRILAEMTVEESLVVGCRSR